MTFLTHPDDATLQRLAEGPLPEAEERAVRSHLEHCRACQGRSARMATLFAVLAAPHPQGLAEPRPDFLASVMSRVDAEIARSAVPVLGPVVLPSRELRFLIAARAVGIGAGLAVAGGALFWAGGGTTAGIDPMMANFATGLTTMIGRSGLLLTVVRAGAPVLAASAVASLALLTPFFLKAMQAVQPARLAVARATTRSS